MNYIFSNTTDSTIRLTERFHLKGRAFSFCLTDEDRKFFTFSQIFLAMHDTTV